MKINVSHIAKLANLPLTDEEKKKFQNQLSNTLKYIDKLNEVGTENLKETSQVTDLKNITRNDVATISLPQEEALSNTKNKHAGMFKVKAILKN